eukprot:3069521-Pyramimonas_sp.AAC.1
MATDVPVCFAVILRVLPCSLSRAREKLSFNAHGLTADFPTVHFAEDASGDIPNFTRSLNSLFSFSGGRLRRNACGCERRWCEQLTFLGCIERNAHAEDLQGALGVRLGL